MSGNSIDPELLELLLAVKQQMETDAVEIEQSTGWFQSLDKMIDQGRMPTAWERLVAWLKEHGHELGRISENHDVSHPLRVR